MAIDKTKIYFDSNATTPISKDVLKTVIKTFQEIPGNPSSITNPGRLAKGKIIAARKVISLFLECNPQEIFFTSGGTESIQTLIQGITSKRSGPIITTSIEHKAVLDILSHTKLPIKFLSINHTGVPSIQEIEELTKNGAAAIVLSLVNGETGSILPIKEIAAIAKMTEMPLIIDGVAAIGKMQITLYPGITAMAFSGHKFHGPKGVGFCYLKKNTPFTPLFKGGGQEHGLRAGTENTPGILGLSQAIKEISEDVYTRLQSLREYFEINIKKVFPNCTIHGGSLRISNVTNVHFKGMDGDHLLIYLDRMGITASLGSACSSGSLEPSHVLIGMGYPPKHAGSSLRFSFNKYNHHDEIDYVCEVLSKYKELFSFKDSSH